MYKRKKARWITLFDKIDKIIEKPIDYTPEYLTKEIKSNKSDAGELSVGELVLKPLPSSAKKLWLYRVLAVLALLFCLVVLATEATVIYDP